MDYSSIPGFDEYKLVHEKKCRQMKRLEHSPLVLFLDGKNATKNHNFPYRGNKNFTSALAKAARSVLKGYTEQYYIYAVMDEVTCIFPKGNSLGMFLGEDTEDTVLSLFVSRIVREFTKSYDCDFKGVAYYTDDPVAEIEFRKLVGYATALEYYAKEHLNPQDYRKKGIKEIETKLREVGLWNDWKNEPGFYSGIYYEQKAKKSTEIRIPDVSDLLI